jgi:hypothetical protein
MARSCNALASYGTLNGRRRPGTKVHGGAICHPGPPGTPACCALGPGTADGGTLPPRPPPRMCRCVPGAQLSYAVHSLKGTQPYHPARSHLRKYRLIPAAAGGQHQRGLSAWGPFWTGLAGRHTSGFRGAKSVDTRGVAAGVRGSTGDRKLFCLKAHRT